jgi:DNA-binding transcriptional regulator YdaS (Cro superfamily)
LRAIGDDKLFEACALVRGIHKRVAAKLGLDPSFVSRVASAKRKSPAVMTALREELEIIRETLNGTLSDSRIGVTKRQTSSSKTDSSL